MQVTVGSLNNHHGVGGVLVGPGSPVGGARLVGKQGGVGVKGIILGKMALPVHGKQTCRKAGLMAKGVCTNGAGVAVVGVVLETTSWTRCVLSQACIGKMKDTVLEPAHLGLNVSSAPFLFVNVVKFTSPSEPVSSFGK